MIPLSTGDPLRLGPYRLLGVLGEGGMGKVYFGRDNTGRTAAVKVLRPELAHDGDLARRFVREARTAQAVTGGGVARVLGAQTEGGRPWIAAEYLPGPTLEEAVAAYGPLSEAGFRALAASLARALENIHAARLVHRDLKPANIVLTSDGPRVIDFGIARPEHGLTLTVTGQIPVTPGYGAPEQVLGQRVGPAADVFSLGAVLVYAVTGHRAYDGPHVAGVQYEVVHGEADLRLVPEHLRPLILPCLAKEPSHRPLPQQIAHVLAPPRNSGDIWRQGPLAADIARREGVATSLAATHTPEPSVGPSRRRLLTNLSAAGTVAVVGATTAWWLTGNGRRSAERPVVVPPAADTPAAELLKSGDSMTPLWGPLEGLPVRARMLLPVRDVLVHEAVDGGLAARRVTDGVLRWRRPEVVGAAGYVSIADRLVAAGDGGGALHAFVASTGERAWTVSCGAERVLAADARAVYVMTRERQLRAVSAATRKVLWSVPTPVRTSAAEPPAAATGQDRLVLFPSDGNVLALFTATGRIAWGLPDQGSSALAPAVEGDRVYLGGKALTARSLSDGSEIWSVAARYEGWGPPTVRGNEVYAVDDELYQCRANDGKKQWMLYNGGNVSTRTPPAVQGGTVWVAGSNNGGLSVADTRNGRQTPAYVSGESGEYTVTGDGNRIFVAQSGTIVSLPVWS
ncbi:serine/threonine-protein kinase [Streptomyces wuyuanensis]|uniref:serine/threonine-protein kinase n=1 Tax=Streptomyces wuyuanensis TaxID=1196353 RepID=UPI00371E55E1